MWLRTLFATMALMAALALSGCTGGQETTAEELENPSAEVEQTSESVMALKALDSIHAGIPRYQGAQFRPDLTERDKVAVRSQFGDGTEVYTLATTDSFPKVWHYYVTYLAQYRGFKPPRAYPPENQRWRSMQVNLNAAMQDPFIPGDAMSLDGRHVILQIAETEAQPPIVIRYIVTPQPVVAPDVALQ